MYKILSALIVLTLLVGCTTTEVHETTNHTEVDPNVKPAPAPNVTFDDPNNSNSSSNTEQNNVPAPKPDNTKPDWANKTIQATGTSAADYERFRNPAQAKLMAKRGAKMDALRNLMERVLGLRLSSKTLVKDMVTQNDEIKGAVNGFVREAKEVGYNFHDGIATVNVELKLYNLYTFFKEKRVYYK